MFHIHDPNLSKNIRSYSPKEIQERIIFSHKKTKRYQYCSVFITSLLTSRIAIEDVSKFDLSTSVLIAFTFALTFRVFDSTHKLLCLKLLEGKTKDDKD